MHGPGVSPLSTPEFRLKEGCYYLIAEARRHLKSWRALESLQNGWDSDGGWEQLWLSERWYGGKEQGYTVGRAAYRAPRVPRAAPSAPPLASGWSRPRTIRL